MTLLASIAVAVLIMLGLLLLCIPIALALIVHAYERSEPAEKSGKREVRH